MGTKSRRFCLGFYPPTGEYIMSTNTESSTIAFVTSALSVATRVNSTTIPLGTESYGYPTLQSIGLAAPDSYDEKEVAEGVVRKIARYKDEQLDFIQDCIITKVDAICRNAVKITKVGDGATYELARTLPTDWASLLETGQGSQYFAIRKLTLSLFETFLLAAGISADNALKLVKAVSSETLAVRSDKAKANIGGHVQRFIDSLDDDQLAETTAYLNKITGWLASEEDEEDFDI